MNILLLNASPRVKRSSTYVILLALEEGMKAANNRVESEIINLYKYDIHPCPGCYSCWTKTIGKCIYQDDMVELLLKYTEPDILVFGTPLYHFTIVVR